MNINTSQSTDSLKGTEITGSGASKGDKKETSEASGFFDKLTALMFGSSEQAKGKIAGKLLQAKASDGGNDPMAALKKLGWTKHQLEHLTEKELSKVANQQGIEVAELKSIIQQMPDVMTAKPALASAKNAQPSDADKTDIPAAMDEGKQLLGKLQQANQTLTKSASQVAHGKDLPQKVGVTAAEPVAPALQKNKLVHTGKEDESTTFAERPISQKELAQLVALKKQHPELSESDLKKQLVAQRIKQDEMTESETASLGVSHHASPNQPVVMTNAAAATASAEKGGGVSDALHKGAQPSAIQTASASVTAQTGMSEHKLSPQGNMVTPQDGGSTGLPSQSQQQTTASPLGQGANPLVAASLMATNAAKGAPSNVIEKGLSEKALNAMTEMKGAKRGTSSPESSLAAQLSSASGQSLSATQKVDGTQQAASPQLQLSKDGADQVAEKVHMMMSKNLKSIDIRLDPPEMGKMHIKMQMNNDGGATVHFTVASHHARDALEQSMPRLRDMLSQQGVQLGGTSVQQDGGSQQQSFASANGGQPQSQRQAGRGVAGGTQENLDGDIKLDLNVASKRDGISYYA